MSKNNNRKVKNEFIGFSMWKLSNLWQRQLNLVLTKYNLTHAQFAVLDAVYFLSFNSKQLTQSKICQFAGTDKMMTSKIISSLEEKKFAKRVENKEDLRSNSIGITEKGKSICEKAKKDIQNFEAKFFSSLEKKGKNFQKKIELIIVDNDNKKVDN